MLEGQASSDTHEQRLLLVKIILLVQPRGLQGSGWDNWVPAPHLVAVGAQGQACPALLDTSIVFPCFWACELVCRCAGCRGTVGLKTQVLVKGGGNLVIHSSAREILWAVDMLEELARGQSTAGGAGAPLQQWFQALALRPGRGM